MRIPCSEQSPFKGQMVKVADWQNTCPGCGAEGTYGGEREKPSKELCSKCAEASTPKCEHGVNVPFNTCDQGCKVPLEKSAAVPLAQTKQVGFLKALYASTIPGDVVFWMDGNDRCTICFGDWHEEDVMDEANALGRKFFKNFEEPDDTEIGRPPWVTTRASNKHYQEKSAALRPDKWERLCVRRGQCPTCGQSNCEGKVCGCGKTLSNDEWKALRDKSDAGIDLRTKEAGVMQRIAPYKTALKEVLLGRKLPPMETILKDVPSDADDLSQLLPRIRSLVKTTFSKSAAATPARPLSSHFTK